MKLCHKIKHLKNICFDIECARQACRILSIQIMSGKSRKSMSASNLAVVQNRFFYFQIQVKEINSQPLCTEPYHRNLIFEARSISAVRFTQHIHAQRTQTEHNKHRWIKLHHAHTQYVIESTHTHTHTHITHTRRIHHTCIYTRTYILILSHTLASTSCMQMLHVITSHLNY